MVKRLAKDIAFTLLRFVPLIVCVFLIAAYFLTGQDITAESILNYAPAKSLSIFFHDRIEHRRRLPVSSGSGHFGEFPGRPHCSCAPI